MSRPSIPENQGELPEDASGRLHRWVSSGQQWTASEQARVEKALQSRRDRSLLIGTGLDIRDLDVDVGGGLLAGAVAFRMFLFLVPFVYISFSLFGLAAKMASEDPAQLAKSVGITGVLAHAVVSAEDLGFWSHLVLIVGAAVALIITAQSLVKALFVVHWLIWRIPRAKPSGWWPGLIAIGITLFLTVLSIATNDLRQHVGTLGSLVAILIVTGAAFGTWWWVSWRLPHAPVPATGLVPGAVLMAIGVDLLHVLTTYGIAHYVARKSNTYGAVGVALAVLLWVYVLGRIVVGSVGLNATLWRRHQESPGVRSSDT